MQTQEEIITRIINKKYDEYETYMGFNSAIINNLLYHIEKNILTIDQIINTLIKKDNCKLLMDFCDSITEIPEASKEKITNYLINKKYYWAMSELCNITDNIQYERFLKCMLKNNKFEEIRKFIYIVKNENMKNKGIDYLIKSKSIKHITFIIEDIYFTDTPYKKLFQGLKLLPNGLEIITNLAIEKSKHQPYAIKEVINSNNEELIKLLYDNIIFYENENIQKELKQKIDEINRKYIPPKLKTTKEILNIQFKEEILEEYDELLYYNRGKLAKELKKCIMDLESLYKGKIKNNEYTEIIHKYYDIDIINLKKLCEQLLGTTKLQKSTETLNNDIYFPETYKKPGPVETHYKVESIYPIRRSVFNLGHGTIITSDPFMRDEETIVKTYKTRSNLYITKKYNVIITYYHKEESENLSNILTIEELEKLIKTKKIIITSIQQGKYFGYFVTEEEYKENQRTIKKLKNLSLDTSNISINYRNYILPILKKYFTKEQIEKDITTIINYLKQKNEKYYGYMIANYIDKPIYIDNAIEQEITKKLKKTIKK